MMEELEDPIPVIVHFGDRKEEASITAVDDEYVVHRGSGDTIEKAYYVTGEHFGTWMCEDQRGSESEYSMWFEEIQDATDS